MQRHFLVSQTQKFYEQNPLIKVKKKKGFDRKIVQVDVTLLGNWKKATEMLTKKLFHHCLLQKLQQKISVCNFQQKWRRNKKK
jgi:hypothetical protein